MTAVFQINNTIDSLVIETPKTARGWTAWIICVKKIQVADVKFCSRS